ncbi:hypothetical protein K492DRAFT_204485 [Lichtheimia hyalospora FSU 10163]|nr:hypothetical protein K492DRAFT_204485 [Lichtheimia hyalospora FSU 10163]
MPLFNLFKNKQQQQQQQGYQKIKSADHVDVNEAYSTKSSSEDRPITTSSSATSSISDKDTISMRESEKTPQNILLIPPGQEPTVSSHLDLQKSLSSPSTAREQRDVTSRYKDHDEFDAMLQQQTQDISEQVEKREHQQEQLKPKSTRLTFELPERPPRPSSRGSNYAYPFTYKRYSLPDEIILSSIRKIPRRRSTSLFRFFGSSSSGKHDHQRPIVLEPTYGDHVTILHRPSVLTGRVRYIGPVDHAPGNDWFGIELDVPVGSNDGVRDGKRYFQTDRNRGIFVRREDVELLDE